MNLKRNVQMIDRVTSLGNCRNKLTIKKYLLNAKSCTISTQCIMERSINCATRAMIKATGHKIQHANRLSVVILNLFQSQSFSYSWRHWNDRYILIIVVAVIIIFITINVTKIKGSLSSNLLNYILLFKKVIKLYKLKQKKPI